jgi:acetyl-CoA carboxylase biotin carboxyl carrier protein
MELNHIKGLVELMAAHDLNRIEIREGETHIVLRRGATVVTTLATAPAAHAPMHPAPGPVAAAPPPAAPTAVPVEEKFIRSPMVGTFYERPDPNSPNFVNIGDVVNPSSVVCLVEAMKVFNEIKAETSGRITRMLVANGQAVEFDQPLFALA